MIYEFECKNCGEKETFVLSVSDYTKYREGVSCLCGGPVKQVFDPPKVFSRLSFPKGFYHEHVGPGGTVLRDKKHFLDTCAENGWTSRFFDGI